MILGFIIMFVILVAILPFVHICLKERCDTAKERMRFVITRVLITIVISSVFAGAVQGMQTSEKEYVASFESYKLTYEEALSSEEIGGLERLEIVKQIADKNEELARKKVRVNRWYNCLHPHKDEINNLERIRILNE